MHKGYVPEPIVTPAKLDWLPSKMPPGWNNSNKEWVLPDWAYSKERHEEQWAKYLKLKEFEEKSNFKEQTNLFLSDYPHLMTEKNDKEEKKVEIKSELEKEELIQLCKCSRGVFTCYRHIVIFVTSKMDWFRLLLSA